jgi:8-oxo-dGTP pyrophosphatase MutT (NUDIX family)
LFATAVDCLAVDLTVHLRRRAYRAAYGLLRLYWWAARPQLRGVKCVLRDRRGHVLLVRHSYGPKAWDLPGGIRRRDESPAMAARREMAEELGLDRDGWTPLGVIRGRLAYRHDTIHVYGLALESEAPPVTLQPAELLASMWCAPEALPQPLAFYASGILGEVIPTRSSPAACS